MDCLSDFEILNSDWKIVMKAESELNVEKLK